MFDWITQNEAIIWSMAVFSIISFVASLLLIPVLVIRIPEDYFAEKKRHRWEPWAHQHPFIRWSLLIAKNALGYLFIILGIAMLVLPGQGILTILIGIMFINFPGKYRLERWVVMQAPVLNTINRLRHRSGRAPLITWMTGLSQQTIAVPELLDALQQTRPGLFEKALKQKLEQLPAGTLPLEKGTSRGGFVDDSDISVTVITVKQNENSIQAKIGVFFTEIIVGCGCGDDPMPENAYCEMLISIDRTTSAAGFEVIQP